MEICRLNNILSKILHLINSNGSGDNLQAKINLPIGGAIRGFGEKFETNPVTGTASLNVSLTISEG
ncbi:MAG: hypothetical protein RR356_07170 [Bacteroidales bacterium]